ncbi:ArsR/SmtB family transcription factor [Microbulbifer pacificus]|uniref:Metalloregulator ArsR/SmtB family transcription factor n=1 Tax=Microbulbifer pacificus TaxID=407164 RepID=A0AAU0MXQ9_9GAMM|nr:metalloregulator ArsR/SmtB family transcription factor [Microbulbifer pacificus]WOX05395.1 metalloregulator ArsR/SmtB family transcription factor [Microbulbifer pacificus]
MPDTTEISLDKMRASAGGASLMLRSLGNPDRLLLLCLLGQEELCVSDLEERLDIHQPSLSQQLGVLRREGLVATRKEGKRVYYRVADPKVLTLLQTLYQLYCAE